MDIKGFYQQMGVDYDDVLRRLSSETLIAKYLGKMLRDPSFKQLTAAFLEHDHETAFRAAHTIKGMCLNLDLHPLLESSSALTERLRELPLFEGIISEYQQVCTDYGQVMRAIKSVLETDDRG